MRTLCARLCVCVHENFIWGGGIYLVKNSYCVLVCLFMLHWAKWNHIKHTIWWIYSLCQSCERCFYVRQLKTFCFCVFCFVSYFNLFGIYFKHMNEWRMHVKPYENGVFWLYSDCDCEIVTRWKSNSITSFQHPKSE